MIKLKMRSLGRGDDPSNADRETSLRHDGSSLRKKKRLAPPGFRNSFAEPIFRDVPAYS